MKEYTPEFEERIIEWSRKRQSEKRFAHTERVVETVTVLAEQWSPEHVMALRLAGWIHDATKSYSDSKMLQRAGEISRARQPHRARKTHAAARSDCLLARLGEVRPG